MRGVLRVALSVLIAVLCLAVMAVGRAAAASRSRTVSIQVNGGQGVPGGAFPFVQVSVAGGRSVPVVIDTGSVGLHIFAPVVPGSAKGKPFTSAFVDGTTYTGVIEKQTVSIGGVKTSAPVDVGVVTRIGCMKAIPNCPTAGGMKAALKSVLRGGGYGVMGIGLGATDPPNPLLALPKPYCSSWSIALNGKGGALVLGASLPAHPLAQFTLARQRSPIPGMPAWNNTGLPMTFSVGTSASLHNISEGALFDSGNPIMRFFGGTLGASSPTGPGSNVVASGLTVAISVPGAASPFWSFTTGPRQSQDKVIARPTGIGRVNLSVAAFYAFTVYYDTLSGSLALGPAS